MTKYHINDRGEPGICEAHLEPCRFGSTSQHYDSEASARKAYENQSDTFGSILLMNKRRELARTNFRELNPIKEDGLTENMRSFKDALQEIASITQNYRQYRLTGLNEEFAVPKTPSYLTPYLNKEYVENSFRAKNYTAAMEMYKEAIKAYYMEKVFNSDDVDVMLSDDDIEELTRYQDY